MIRTCLAAIVALLCACDADLSTGEVQMTPLCKPCITEKTCQGPVEDCDWSDPVTESAYQSCLRTKVLVGLCEEELR